MLVTQPLNLQLFCEGEVWGGTFRQVSPNTLPLVASLESFSQVSRAIQFLPACLNFAVTQYLMPSSLGR